MLEKRKNNRLPLNITLTIEELYKQDDIKLEDLNEEIEVVNISKGGIAFETKDELPIGFYFNSRIRIDDEKSFFSVLKIIRKSKNEDVFNYGCEFVGLASVLALFIDEYEEEIEKR